MVHLVVGAGGVAGAGITRHLAFATADPVYALSRRGSVEPDLVGRVTPLVADLSDADATRAAMRRAQPTHVYYAAQAAGVTAADVHPRQTQAVLRFVRPFVRALTRVPLLAGAVCTDLGRRSGLVDRGQNLAMFRNLLASLNEAPVAHVALLTGGRTYGVHLGSLWAGYPGVLREDGPRPPGRSWYADVERALVAAPGAFTRSVHRPHFVLGAAATANASLLHTLGGYAALCRAARRPLLFLGGPDVFERRGEAVDAELIGAQMRWAASTPGEYLVTNGAPGLWTEVWPALAERYGLAWDVPSRPCALPEVIPNPEEVWSSSRVGLPPLSMAAAFSVPLLHQAMVITWDVTYDMQRSRARGFIEVRDPLEVLARGLARLEQAGTFRPA